MRFRYYFAVLLVFTMFMWSLSWLLVTYLPAEEQPKFTLFQFTYFTVLTGFVHFFLTRAATGKPIRFVNAYMLASTIKLLVSLFVILIVPVFSSCCSLFVLIRFFGRERRNRKHERNQEK